MADRVLFMTDGGGLGPAPIQLVDTGRTVGGLAVYALATQPQGAGGANSTVVATGPAAAGAAISGNPVLVAGSDGTLVRALLTDTGGRALVRLTDGTNLQGLNAASQAFVNTEGRKATYSSAQNGVTLAASATDVLTLYGSASKTVRVTRVELDGIQTTGGAVTLLLVLRSSALTGGTSTTPAISPHDSTNGAATAVVRAYTANPTGGGAFVGIVRAAKVFMPASTATPQPVVWDFTTRNSQALVLRGTGEGLCINLNGVTVTGGVMDFGFEWTEE